MRLNPTLSEWLNLAARWAHIFATILWVGTTYFFTWLDGRFTAHEKGAGVGERDVWMVHSGGFYVVEKRKGLDRLPRELHWFRWEAAFTWLTGAVLLVVVYYLGGALVAPHVREEAVACYNELAGGRLRGLFDLSAHYQAFAVASSLLSLALSWAVYDLLVRSPLGRSEKAFAAVSFLLTAGLAYALTRVLSERAAYLHVGAAYGTIMAANVWMRILPAQRRMVAALREGRPADEALGATAKLRSKHNTFMVVPVVFTMISNHFPSTYGHDYNWAVLSALVLVGWAAAYFIRRA